MNQIRKIRTGMAGIILTALAAATGPVNAQESAPQAAPPDPAQIVAEINGEKVTRQQVIDSAADLPAQIRAQIDLIFPQLVDRYVGLTLIEAEGRKQNLAEDAEVKAKVKEAEEIAIRQAYVARVLKEKVTDDAIKAAYETKAKELAKIEEVRAQHILVENEDAAKDIITALQGGADFAALAKEKSTDKGSGPNGGELGWFTAERMVKEFSDAAFALKAGEISTSPVKSQFGWHVIKVNERRLKQPPPLEELRPDIQAELSEQAIQDVVNELRKGADVKVLIAPATAP